MYKPSKIWYTHNTHIRPDTSTITWIAATFNNTVHQDTDWRLCVLYAILNYIALLTCVKIWTKRENQFRSHWTSAAEDIWMLKGVLIHPDCSAVMQVINIFAIYHIKLFIYGFAFICIFCSTINNYNFFVWNAVDQHFHLTPLFWQLLFLECCQSTFNPLPTLPIITVRNSVDQHCDDQNLWWHDCSLPQAIWIHSQDSLYKKDYELHCFLLKYRRALG